MEGGTWPAESVALAGLSGTLESPRDAIDGAQNGAQRGFLSIAVAQATQQLHLDERDWVNVWVAPVD